MSDRLSLTHVTGLSIVGTEHEQQDTWDEAGELAWVLDGATRFTSKESTQVTDWVSRLNSAIKTSYRNTPEATLNDILADAILSAATDGSTFHPSATVAMVRFIEGDAEWLVLGDAAVLISSRNGQVTWAQDRRISRVGMEVREARREARHAGDERRASTLTIDLLRLEDDHRNKKGGFWVAQTNPDAAYQAISGMTRQATSAILMSDGVANEIRLGHLGSFEKASERASQEPESVMQELRSLLVNRGAPINNITMVVAQWKS